MGIFIEKFNEHAVLVMCTRVHRAYKASANKTIDQRDKRISQLEQDLRTAYHRIDELK
jgi:predicted RNase H-like nuclease (RuvC/YqgF family)